MIRRRALRRILLPLLLACAPISWSSEIAQEGPKGSNAADGNELALPAIRFTTADGSASGNCLTQWLFKKGLTRLQVAAGYCDAMTVQFLLDRGFDIEELNNEEENALHVASRLGNTETVLALIENGADVEAGDHYGYTPLHIASISGNPKTVLALIENGADIHARESGGKTALLFAAGLRGNVEIITTLVEHGADIEARDDYSGFTPLHNAAIINPALIPVLLELGADMESLDSDGETPLQKAAFVNNIVGMRFLIEQGADMSGALKLAAITGGLEPLEMLLEREVDINAQDEFGLTALHTLSSRREGNSPGIYSPPGEALRLILNNGADVEARAGEGSIPIYLSSSLNGTIEFAREEYFQDDPELIKGPAIEGFAPLHIAALLLNTGPISILIEWGADIEADAPSIGTPLHLAAAYGTASSTKALLDAGAEVSSRNGMGDQPIHLAAKLGEAETLSILLEEGADIDGRADSGLTALHYAAQYGDHEVVTALLGAGAQAGDLTDDGKTPFDLAKDNERLQGTTALEQLEEGQGLYERIKGMISMK